MVTDILNATGINYKPVRFLTPPNETYAVYFDSQTHRGSDSYILIVDHEVSIELYSKKIDEVAEQAIENELIKRGIEFLKDERIWLDTEKLFEVVYTFDYTEKGEIINAR